MKKLAILILLVFLTACAIQNVKPAAETTPPQIKTTAIITEPKLEQKEEIFVKETTRKYGIELKYSGLRDEDNLLCANFYAQDLAKTLPKEDKDPNSWFAYIYLSPSQILRMDNYNTDKNEKELTWSNKYCLVNAEIPNEYVDQEARILYSTLRPDEVFRESYLNILQKDNRKTIDFKDKVR